jgi:hypothetical protein
MLDSEDTVLSAMVHLPRVGFPGLVSGSGAGIFSCSALIYSVQKQICMYTVFMGSAHTISPPLILILDSSRSSDLRVGLFFRRLQTLRRQYDHPASSQLLLLVDALMRQHKIKSKHIRGIVVASGPGPFSALRTGCAVANAMSFALKIPAVGVKGDLTMRELAEQGIKMLKHAKVGTIIAPHYGKPPNITKPKKHR